MTAALGQVGASVGLADLSDNFARDLEQSGWEALWVGPSVASDLVEVDRVLAATESIPVVTAITTIWSATPAEIAVAYHRVVNRFGDRFVLGLGTAHAGINAPLQAKPLQAMKEVLDGLDAAGVPVDGRLLAALGPKMTELAGQRSLGAHPYRAPASTIPEARQLLGADALLAQSLLAVITDQDDDLLAVGRQAIEIHLTLDNYRRNFLRAGYTETDLDNGGTEGLVRALVSSTATLRESVDTAPGRSRPRHRRCANNPRPGPPRRLPRGRLSARSQSGLTASVVGVHSARRPATDAPGRERRRSVRS